MVRLHKELKSIVDVLLRAFGHLDRFVEVNKMIGDGVAGGFAGDFRLGNGGLVEVPPLGVSEQMLDVPGEPVFHPVFGLMGVSFEGGGERLDAIGIHAASRRRWRVWSDASERKKWGGDPAGIRVKQRG